MTAEVEKLTVGLLRRVMKEEWERPVLPLPLILSPRGAEQYRQLLEEDREL